MEFDLSKIIEEQKVLSSSSSFLLAISGGADSVFLFHQFASSNLKFEVAHCNFKLRGNASDLDELFVEQLCKEHSIPFHVNRFDTKNESKESGASIQLTARNLRYNWFNELLIKQKLEFLVTAHHLDDRIETFFLNLFRGTGLKGLSPIPMFHENKFRPLIHLEKREILNSLDENNTPFREDASNADDKYSRNNIRLNLLPKIEREFPNYRLRFKENLDRLESTNQYLSERKKEFITSNLKKENNSYWIPDQELTLDQNKLWLLEYFGGHHKHLKELNKLLKSHKGKQLILQDSKMVRESNKIIIIPKELGIKNIDFFIEQIPFENEYLSCVHSIKIDSFNSQSLYIDPDKIKFPLKVRNWRIGDRFQPLGMRGSKLISDYLTDRKTESTKRNSVLVILSENEIIGVLGYTCSNNVKLKSKNTNSLIISMK